MSAKNRAGGSSPDLDVCLTPYPLALACCLLLEAPTAPEGAPRLPRVLEPSAGDGVWLQVMRAVYGTEFDVTAIELRNECHERLVGLSPPGDPESFTALRVITGRRFQSFMERGGGFDMVIGNPPYTEADAFVEHSLFLTRPGGVIAMLLRLNYRAPRGKGDRRRRLFKKNPAWRYYTAEDRPSFYGDGATDATEACLFVFRKGVQAPDDGILRTFAWRVSTRGLEPVIEDIQDIHAADWSTQGGMPRWDLSALLSGGQIERR